MSRTISVGIDIGTYQIKVVIAEHVSATNENTGERSGPRVLGTGFAESHGLRHGYIVNSGEVSEALKVAVDQAEKASGVKIKRAYVSMGGIGLSSITSTGSVAISRGDAEISDLDLKKVLDVARESIPSTLSQNRTIINECAIKYRVDGKDIMGNHPLGLKGVKLEVKALFITCLESHIKDLIKAVEDLDIEVTDVVASPIAASFVTLTKAQKIAGVVLANIGSETVSIAVFENNIPISLEVFPVGSANITNDIALGLRIPLEEAETVKHGGVTHNDYPKKKIDEIVAARLSDIFELIDAHLKKIGRAGLLPAGIVITGGGSTLNIIEDFAKTALKLPSKIAHLSFPEKEKGKMRDAFFAVAIGLCIVGFSNSRDESSRGPIKVPTHFIKDTIASTKKFFRPFLP